MPKHLRPLTAKQPTGLTRGLKLAPVGIVLFWLVVMGGLYMGMKHYLKPKPVVVPKALN